LVVGDYGAGNSLTIASNASVYSMYGYLGLQIGASNNAVLVTGSGTVWNNINDLGVGVQGGGNSLTIASNATVYSGDAVIGEFSGASNNTVLVTGSGTVWNNTIEVNIGLDSAGNTLTVSNTGSLFVTNAAGNAALFVSFAGGTDSLIINDGVVTVNQLWLTNGANSILTFNAGTLDSGETFVSTPQNFTIGDGTDTAVFHLSGGDHSFLNGALEIQNHAVLTGCGTINGNVVIDANGTVLANCGGTLTFTGSMTNNGSIVATNGTFINFYGPVVNNGQIGPTNRVYYYPLVPSTGSTNSWINSASDKWESGVNWSAGAPSIIQPAVYITNAANKTVTMDGATVFAFPDTLAVSNLTVSAPSNSTNTLWLNSMPASTLLQIVSNLTVNTGGIVAVTNSTLEVDSSGSLATNGLFIGVSSAGEHLSIHGGQIVDDFGYLGYNSSSSNNTALVSGSGSVWSNAAYLFVGYSGSGNSLAIASNSTVITVGGNSVIGYQTNANNNSVLVTGSGSVWSNESYLYVGESGMSNSLTIINGGTVYADFFASIGDSSNADYNTALVSGSGSVWNNDELVVGDYGAGNSLTIASNASVYSMYGYLGLQIGASNNAVLVTGSGTVWNNINDLGVGVQGGGNSLTIASNATVYSGDAVIGEFSGASNNAVLVTGSGSLWSTTYELYVGVEGSGNSLTIASSGIVYNGYGGDDSFIGYQTNANNNTVLVTGSGSIWNNAFDLIVGNYGADNSLTIASSGTVYNGYDSYIGAGSGASNNTVLVTGTGSVWSNTYYLYIGYSGAGNSLTIASNGTAYGTAGYIGEMSGANNNTVLVTGTGSVWSNANYLLVGDSGAGNSLTIASSGTVYNGYDSYIGAGSGASNNTVLVTGSGSVWQNGGTLYIGYADSSNVLTIAGGSVLAGNAFVGSVDSYSGIGSNNALVVDGGSLFVTNAGGGVLLVSPTGGRDSLILNGGSVTVDQLVLTNGANSILTFNSGTLDSGETFVSTPQNFTIGDGTDTAVFHLSGGEHIFLNGALEIRNHALLTGCGAIYGNVRIDAGGTVLADCGGTLTVFGSVTNNGSIVATNGTVINFYGPVVNNGQIGPTNSIHYYSIVLSTGATNSWISPASDKWENGLDWLAGPPSIIQPALYITNASSKTVTMDVITAIAFTNTLTISNLTVSSPSGSTNTLLLNSMPAGTALQIVSNLTVNTGGIVAVENSALEVDRSGAIPGNSGLFVGINSAGEHLGIQGGQVSDDGAYLGYNSSSSNNTVLVTGSGSVWSNAYYFYVGGAGAGNSLTISNSAMVLDGGTGSIGSQFDASNNTVLVTGSGSVWSNASDLYVGDKGTGNSLTITSDGTVYNLDGEIGREAGNNTVLVTGSGSVWSNAGILYVGQQGAVNSLTISNGSTVYSAYGYIGYDASSSNNTVLVTGTGSVWSNAFDLSVGYYGSGNSLTITNGAMVTDDNDGVIGNYFLSSNNLVTVSGNGAIWEILGVLYVGSPGSSNELIIGTGGTVIAGNAVVGLDDFSFTSNNVLQVNGGSLFVTNSSGSGQLVVGESTGPGAFILNSGSVTVNQLMVTNGLNGVFTFKAGTLASGGTFVTNNQVFVVGDGTDAATFQLNGGVHLFANNLAIRSNAFLTGCGTIEGNVTIDPGGTVLANCGGMLTFTGSVTNNGIMQAVDGSVLQAYGTVVNNGIINAVNGSTEFLGGLVNNGCVLTESDSQISSITRSGNNVTVQIQSPACPTSTYQLQVTPSLKPATWTNLGASQSGTGGVLTFSDSGGATNHPGRFYRIDVTVP
jgi:T5SS/PEP-CTERM-associated repeat protein